MNLRTGVDPKLLVCRHEGNAGSVGRGMDIETNPDYPELFSLYLYPEFRRYTIGLLLEPRGGGTWSTTGIGVAVCPAWRQRPTSSCCATGFRRGSIRDAPARTFRRGSSERCSTCELHQEELSARRRPISRSTWCERSRLGQARIGEVTVDHLPREFVIRSEVMRRQIRELSEEDRREKYRPYWL